MNTVDWVVLAIIVIAVALAGLIRGRLRARLVSRSEALDEPAAPDRRARARRALARTARRGRRVK